MEGVPGLKDIDILGALFRSESRERKRSNMMVFLRPVVLRDAEAAQRLSLDRYEQIRALVEPEAKVDDGEEILAAGREYLAPVSWEIAMALMGFGEGTWHPGRAGMRRAGSRLRAAVAAFSMGTRRDSLPSVSASPSWRRAPSSAP